MHRFFAVPENEYGFIIKGDDAKHISKVLRLNIGSEIIVCDGKGTDYLCKIDDIEKNHVHAAIISKEKNTAEPDTSITLFQGVPKAGKMEYIVQKCTELGVFGFVPVNFKRSVSKMENKSKIERLNKVAEEASKQSGRGIVPKVKDQMDFTEMLKELSEFKTIIVPYEAEDYLSLKKALSRDESRNIAVVIGPEGGFDEEEIEALKKIGANIVTLGKRILRTETAGMATIAMIMYDKDEIL